MQKYKKEKEVSEAINIEQEILCVVYAGNMGFSDARHFRNFMKYFFGSQKTGRHIVNDSTHLNVLTTLPTDSDRKYIFCEDSPSLTKYFMGRFKKKLEKYDEYLNDVLYVPFLFGAGDVAVSNFLQYNDELDEIELTLVTDGEAVYNKLCEQCGSEKILEITVENFARKYKKLIPFSEYTDKRKRLDIEKILHQACQREYPIPEENILLSTSHVDQFEDHPDYHIHRVFKAF